MSNSKKRVIAGVLAVMCCCSLSSGFVPSALQSVSVSSVVTAAESSYKYANNIVYKTEIEQVKNLKQKGDNAGDYTIKDGDLTTDEKGYELGITKITITHEEGSETVTDTVDYAISIIKYTGTSLNPVAACKVNVSSGLKAALNNLDGSFMESETVIVVAPDAFAGTDIKTVDLDGIQYIGEGAFSGCAYLPVVDVPESVVYLGGGAFSGSGLKTLSVGTEFTRIPDNLAKNTNLSEVTFKHPDLIIEVGTSAFSSTKFSAYPLTDCKSPLYIDKSAFSDCTYLKEITIPDNVYFINNSAFEGCTAAKTIKLGKCVVGINESCFKKCTGVTEVTFNDALCGIGGGAFNGCTSLVSVSGLPDSLSDWKEDPDDPTKGTGFANAVFANCTSLKSLKLPESLYKVPESVCYNCTSLNSTVLGKNIRNIGKSAFENCPNLEEIAFTANELDNIEETAFKGCSKLRKLVATECDSIGNEAFADCTALTTVEFSADTWGEGVFSGCTALKTASLGSCIKEQFPAYTFNGCTSLTGLPNTDLSSVELIQEGAFKGCSSLESINFDSVVIIKSRAFANCLSLKKINNGEIKAEDYGESCFEGCSSLTQAVNSVASTIGSSAFSNSGITKLTIKGTSGTTVVFGDKAFANCKNLKTAEVQVDDDLKYSIGNGLFYGDTALTSCIYTGNKVTENMFANCTALKTVTAKNAHTIASNAFNGCNKLTKLDTSENLAIVNDYAFKGCESLPSVPVDENTSFVGDGHFEDCYALDNITVGTLTNGMFVNCKKLSNINIKGYDGIVPQSCFQNCFSLKDFTQFQKGYYLFESHCFAGSGLSGAIDLSDSSVTIEKNAFMNCERINSVNIDGKSIGESAFENCYGMSQAILAVENVDSYAFKGCFGLLDVQFPARQNEPLNRIGREAFYNCGLLHEVIIEEPEKVSIGTEAFGYCTGTRIGNFLLVGDSKVQGTSDPSGAYEYAQENEFEFVDVKNYNAADRAQSKKKLGDVDLNGKISVVDVVQFQKWLVKGGASIYKENADLTGDGKINVFDLVKLKRQVLSNGEEE